MTEHALVGLESYEEYEEGESGDYYDDYESEEYGEIEEEGENDSGPTDSNIPRLFDWQQVRGTWYRPAGQWAGAGGGGGGGCREAARARHRQADDLHRPAGQPR